MTKNEWWSRARSAIAKAVGNLAFDIGDIDLFADLDAEGPGDSDFVVAYATNGTWKVYRGNWPAEQWEGI